MATAEGRLFGTLEIGEEVGRDRLEVILPQGCVTRGFSAAVPHDLLYFRETPDLPESGHDQHKERQAACAFHGSGAVAATLPSEGALIAASGKHRLLPHE